MNILRLTLKKKWFDLIAIGKKTEEYRDVKPYWTKRLTELRKRANGYTGIRKWDEIHFRNGYRKNSPFMRVSSNGIVTSINALTGARIYVLRLGKILEIRNWEEQPLRDSRALRGKAESTRQ